MTAPASEFSRPVKVKDLPARESRLAIEATAAECEALARRFGIIAVDSLAAEFRLKPIAGGPMVQAHGRACARVRQACVVTLEEVPQDIDETFELAYGPQAAEMTEAVVELDDEDPPEPIVDGTIDLGEAAAEQVALALEPYPRAPGAAFADVTEEADSPLAALAAWKPH